LELGFDLVLDLEMDFELKLGLDLELVLDNRERIFLQTQLMVAGRGLLLD
jgi:hypothetical protein